MSAIVANPPLKDTAKSPTGPEKDAIPSDANKKNEEEKEGEGKQEEGKKDEANKKEGDKAPADVPKPQAAPMFKKKTAITSR